MNILECTVLILLGILGLIIGYIIYKVYQTEKRRKSWTPKVGETVNFHMENPVIGKITNIGDTHSTIQLTIRNDRMYPL